MEMTLLIFNVWAKTIGKYIIFVKYDAFMTYVFSKLSADDLNFTT